jgi:hypothetical protein
MPEGFDVVVGHLPPVWPLRVQSTTALTVACLKDPRQLAPALHCRSTTWSCRATQNRSVPVPALLAPDELAWYGAIVAFGHSAVAPIHTAPVLGRAVPVESE